MEEFKEARIKSKVKSILQRMTQFSDFIKENIKDFGKPRKQVNPEMIQSIFDNMQIEINNVQIQIENEITQIKKAKYIICIIEV